MTPMFWAWLLSLSGAGLFFVAGHVWSRQRRFEPRAAELGPSATHQGVLEHERAPGLARADSQARPSGAELEQLRSELTAARTQNDGLERALKVARSDAQTAALQQELSLTRELLVTRDAQLERLREEAARLQTVEVDLERAKREVAELAETTRSLRAQAYAANRPPLTCTPHPTPISTRGEALQLIVDNETECGGARSAVIADELGLLVAASGVVEEYGDALAALGAYLADVGAKTRDVLPLHDVRQVTVRDDHDMTLTVRRLATDDGLALVTLAIDANIPASMQDASI